MRVRFTLAASAALSLALTACASGIGANTGPHPVNSLTQYALRVEPGLDRIALAVHDTGVSPNQNAAIQALAHRYRASGSTWLRVEGPNGGDPVAIEHVWQVKDALERAGVPGDRIQVTGYNGPDPRAPVLVGFESLRAHVPNCAAAARSYELRGSNAPTSNLGCAVNANLAAQIANPGDIAAPQPMGPIDSGRSAVVFANYRQGQATSAPQERLVQGEIAQAVQ